MYSYTPLQWILFFFLYCLVGWLWESGYVSVRKKRLVNRGFLHLPLLPLYGSGAVLILFVTLPFRESLILTYLLGALAATVLEMVVGLGMEAIFKVKYWNYSNQKWNYKGVICLSSSLFWGLLSVLLVHVAHRPLEKMVCSLPTTVLAVLDGGIGVLFLVDMVISVKAALDLARILTAMEKVRKELEEQAQRAQERLEEQAQRAQEKLEAQAQRAQEKWEETSEAIRENWETWKQDWEGRNLAAKQRMDELMRQGQKSLEGMLRRNPTATSRRYRENFALLRQNAEARRRQLQKARQERRGKKKDK